jgi:hypothetical protein
MHCCYNRLAILQAGPLTLSGVVSYDFLNVEKYGSIK